MIGHVLALLEAVDARPVVVVTGHGADEVEAEIGNAARTVRQDPQLGTADAVRVALPEIPADTTQVLVTMADVPLLPAGIVADLVRERASHGAVIALLSARVDNPAGYGRIVRGPDDGLRAIVEDVDADPATLAIDEVNAGTYCFDAAWLRANVERVPPSPAGEHYLTDLVGLATADGQPVRVVAAPRPEEAMGINDRVQLAAAERLMRARIAGTTCARASRSSTPTARSSTPRSASARTPGSSHGRSWAAPHRSARRPSSAPAAGSTTAGSGPGPGSGARGWRTPRSGRGLGSGR
jgi:bifunctional UDP-N-acetylglucosamine pyrophosphorylase/glucosamine-1-phosphate N-acetyltransferase